MTRDIAVVGGGLAGLLLARVLQERGIRVKVYEADASRTARSQGGMLDMHEDTGQTALRMAGLHDGFKGLIHEGGQAIRVLDQHGTVLLDRPDDGQGGRPEVRRGDLRDLLLNSLHPDTVQWGAKLATVTSLGGGRHALHFVNGSVVHADWVVGADGAWSKVRPIVSSSVPQYAGLTYVETWLSNADLNHGASARAAGRGAMFALAPGQGIFTHREPNDIVHAYIAMQRDAAWLEGLQKENPETVVSRMLAEFAGWAPELTHFMAGADGPPVIRPIYSLPLDHTWAPTPGITLIGDAAHLRPPAGDGANLAMLDAAELGHAIADQPDRMNEAVASFEARMFERSATAAQDGIEGMQALLGEDAPHSVLKFFFQP